LVDVLILVVDRRVKAQRVYEVGAFVGPTGDADDARTINFCDLYSD